MQYQRGDFSRNPRLFFLSALALVIGVSAALIAKGLLVLIDLFTNLFYYGELSIVSRAPSMSVWGPWFILVPVVGGLIIGLMARYGSGKIRGHGIPEALEAILFGHSIIEPKVALLKPISSAISIGSGGPFGAEGPIIMTGGAFGSIMAQFFYLTPAERKTLLVAGAAAGMSAVFATPVAAILLAVELLLFEWRPRSLVPVALASACASLVRAHLLGMGPIFPLEVQHSINDIALLSAAIIGVATGAFSAFLSFSLYKLEDLFQKLPIHWMWWPALGGLVVGIGGFIEPRALGVGYDVIADLLNGHLAITAVLVLMAVKGIIWLVALSSGTSGGVLAPLLILGCCLGSVASLILPGDLGAGTWSLIGMCAIMAGMMRSPLTAILFTVELTNDLATLPALLIASILSYAFTVVWMKRSILTEKVARRGFDIYREYSVDPLERFTVKDVLGDKAQSPSEIEQGKDLPMIYQYQSCRTAADKMAASGLTKLLVIERASGKPIGVVTLDALLKARLLSFREETYRKALFPLGALWKRR